MAEVLTGIVVVATVLRSLPSAVVLSVVRSMDCINK